MVTLSETRGTTNIIKLSCWLKRCMDLEIEGRNSKGRPKLTWRQVVREDLRLMDVEEEEEAEDRDYWRFRLDCMRFMANL